MATTQDVMQRLRAGYIATLPEKTATVRALLARLESGDPAAPEEARRFGHQLSGSAASFGWPEIATSGRRVEKAAPLGLADAARALLATLQRAQSQTAEHGTGA